MIHKFKIFLDCFLSLFIMLPYIIYQICTTVQRRYPIQQIIIFLVLIKNITKKKYKNPKMLQMIFILTKRLLIFGTLTAMIHITSKYWPCRNNT